MKTPFVMSYSAMKRLNKHWYEDKEDEKVKLNELPALATDTIDGDIIVALDKLKELVDRVIVVDLTRAEIGIPVVRVLIPGFEVYARNSERIGHRYK
jgi:ribosomal protein S12 methylthiotransferase accessory factor